MNLETIFSQRSADMKASEIRELLKLLDQPDILSFAGGIPDPALFPRDAFSQALAVAMDEEAAGISLQYATSEGYTPLRQWIVSHMEKLGITCGIENVIITAGSQQALDYLGKLFIDTQDTCLVEWPTYLGALGAFKAYQPRFDRLDVGDNRPPEQMVEMARAAGGSVKFSYLSPDFANPTGVTLSEQERLQILTQAEALGCAIIEDAAYQSLRYKGADIPAILALEMAQKSDINQCRTVYLGSFSKTLAPGLRIGWAVAAKPVIDQMVLIKQASDLQTATLNQIAVNHVARHAFQTHVETLRRAYGARLATMLVALKREMPEGVTWNEPEGGMFVWLTLPHGMDGKALLSAALKEKIAFVPGQAFFADGSGENTLRLNFSMLTPPLIETGIARLGSVIRAQLLR